MSPGTNTDKNDIKEKLSVAPPQEEKEKNLLDIIFAGKKSFLTQIFGGTLLLLYI